MYETSRVAHEELVASAAKNVKLGLPRQEELIGANDFAGASRIHPVVLAIDERDREWDIWVLQLRFKHKRGVSVKTGIMLLKEGDRCGAVSQ